MHTYRSAGLGRFEWRSAVAACSIVAGLFTSANPPTSEAATARVEGEVLRYTAAPGESNQVRVLSGDETAEIADAGAVITAGPGCVSVTANHVRCAGSSYIGSATIDVGDRSDEVRPDIPGSVPLVGANVYGGPGDDALTNPGAFSKLYGDDGNDTVVAGGAERITVYGGRGDDHITGTNAFGDSVLNGEDGRMVG